jgi:hypothetical protein
MCSILDVNNVMYNWIGRVAVVAVVWSSKKSMICKNSYYLESKQYVNEYLMESLMFSWYVIFHGCGWI